MIEEGVRIIGENIVEILALVISFVSLAFAYKRTEELEQQGELINKNAQREAVRAGFLNNNQLYQSISDDLINLVKTHPQPWTREDPETVRNWENSRIKNLLLVERMMDLYYYGYHLYRAGIIHDNEWDSYIMWIPDWKDDEQTPDEYDQTIFNEVREDWYQGIYAIQMKSFYKSPTLYRPIVTNFDIDILKILSDNSSWSSKLRFGRQNNTNFRSIKEKIGDMHEKEPKDIPDDVLEARIRVLLDENLVEIIDGTLLGGATYKITSDGRQVYESEKRSNNKMLGELCANVELEELCENIDYDSKEEEKDQDINYFDEITKSRVHWK